MTDYAYITPEDIYTLVHHGILEYLTSGITGMFDMYFFRDAAAQAAIDAGFRMNGDAIILETIKPADDQSDDIILRLYESLRTHANGTLRLPFAAKVYESAMDESETGALLGEGTAVPLAMRPFEIRTLRVVRA